MHIENFAQWVELCPTTMMGLFIESAKEGDPDWMTDIITEINFSGTTMRGNDHPAWIEFNLWLAQNKPVTLDYDQVSDGWYHNLGIRNSDNLTQGSKFESETGDYTNGDAGLQPGDEGYDEPLYGK